MKQLLLLATCLVSASLMISCASEPDLKSPAVKQTIARINFIDSQELAARKYMKLPNVEYVFCSTESAKPKSEESTKKELRFLGEQAGGDALANYSCHPGGKVSDKECPQTTTCTADVIKFDGKMQ